MRAGCALLLVLLSACGTAPSDVEGDEPARVAPVPRRDESADRPPPVRGPDGALLESDERVLGLVLPRGLTLVSEIGTQHVYRSDQPMHLVLAYFGTRLMTGTVERGAGGRATYRNATPAGIDPATAVHMDVTISTSSGAATRVEIVELPPPLLAEPSEEEVRARLETLLRERTE